MNLFMTVLRQKIYSRTVILLKKIKEDLMPIAWHPARWWDWCVSNDKKQGTEKMFLTT